MAGRKKGPLLFQKRSRPVDPNHEALKAKYEAQSKPSEWSKTRVTYSDARAAGTLAWTARLCILATLPHRDPGAQQVFTRQNGAFRYTMRAGTYVDDNGQTRSLGLPFGTIPRVLLCWLTTEAMRTREPIINLGKTMEGFLQELGIVRSGGEHGSVSRIREQMRRFFGAQLSYSWEHKPGFPSGEVQVTSDALLRWSKDNWGLPQTPKSEQELFYESQHLNLGRLPSTITLGQEFFQEVTNRPVPIDLRTVRALQKSPLALDIYYWLTHRISYLNRITTISWDLLQTQFGAQYNRPADFKRKFLIRLKMVQAEYPGLNVLMDYDTGMTIYQSRVHVPMRLVGDTRAKTAQTGVKSEEKIGEVEGEKRPLREEDIVVPF
jgi:hypothetical protein